MRLSETQRRNPGSRCALPSLILTSGFDTDHKSRPGPAIHITLNIQAADDLESTMFKRVPTYVLNPTSSD